MLWLLSFSSHPQRIQVGAYDAQQADEVRLIIKSILRSDGPLNGLLAERVEVQRTNIVNKVTGSVVEILTTTRHGLTHHVLRGTQPPKLRQTPPHGPTLYLGSGYAGRYLGDRCGRCGAQWLGYG